MARPPRPSAARRVLKRMLVGAALIAASAAIGFVAVMVIELEKINGVLERVPKLELGTSVAEADLGDPQTIMLLGSDTRWHQGERLKGRSDTIILVRLDPDADAISVLSVPRDLKVQLRRGGQESTEKINAAYEIGGPKLTAATVSRLLGLDINHVVEVNFAGFREGVDAIGCVYTDIDRRYFNSTENAALYNYAPIDIQPGYQKLCGKDALDFVRFRHDDTDLVRSARQQTFLRQAKQQLSVRGLFDDRYALAELLVKHGRTDIRGRSDIIELARLAAGLAGKPVRQIPFPAQLGPSFVTASQRDLDKVTSQFLDQGDRARTDETLGQPSKPGKPRRRTYRPANGLVDSTDGQWQAQAVDAKLPAYYPSKLAAGSVYAQEPRSYTLVDPNGVRQQAYRMVIDLGGTSGYYGVQGTSWLEPPMLASPSERRKVRGRTLELFYAGSRLATVAWRPKKGGVYWVQNTLTFRLSNRQMIDIAASLRLG